MIKRLLLQRVVLGVATLGVVSVMVFAAVTALPGDLAETVLGQSATEETVRAYRQRLGLDQPAVQRYFIWLAGVVQGDFGVSLANGRPVTGLITGRLGNTLFLALYAAVIAVPLALGLGILAAWWRNSPFDRLTNAGTLMAISLPEFFLAYLLVYWFAQTGWFPAIAAVTPSMDFGTRLYHCFLPALTLTFVITAHMMRMTRAAIIGLLAAPWVEMAKLKGVPSGRLVWAHILPNALAPIANVVAINLAYLLTGVVVVEVVFVYPGLGQLMVDAVAKRDVPVVQAVSLIFASIYIFLNMLSDLLSILSNPRLQETP